MVQLSAQSDTSMSGSSSRWPSEERQTHTSHHTLRLMPMDHRLNVKHGAMKVPDGKNERLVSRREERFSNGDMKSRTHKIKEKRSNLIPESQESLCEKKNHHKQSQRQVRNWGKNLHLILQIKCESP